MSRPLRVYVTCVVAAGGIALAALAPAIELTDRSGALFWLFLLVVADLFPVASPLGGSAVTGATAITFAAVLLFGPGVGAAFGAVSALLTDGIRRRVAPIRVLFNAGQLILSLGLAGLVYHWLGGAAVPGPANSIYDPGLYDALIVVVCYAALIVLNTGLVATAIGLSQGASPLTIWRANYLWAIPSALGVPPVSFLLALLYLRVGAWPVVLLFVWSMIYTRSFGTIMELKDSHRRTLAVLASATDAGIPHLKGCSENVAALGAKIARELGLSSRRCELVEFSGLLHNVGLLGVDRKLLLRPGPLEPGEWDQVRSHVERGAAILEEVPGLRRVADLVRAHHERPDGLGYPRGLAGHDIPLEARVLRVAEAVEAMTGERPYQPRLSLEDALSRLEAGAGSAFDEHVVEAALRLGRSGRLVPVAGSVANGGAR
jgi:hypothetical protein